tara:strand:+ start:40 stop:552 length:513 start_codon:yes stop_codon:yes gene_type:complete
MNKAPFFINAKCEWYYKESKITRHSMVKLFSTILVRDDDNTYHLRTPVEDVLVEVIDAPYMITEMSVTNKRNLSYICLKTNVDFNLILGRKNPLWLEKKQNSDELIPYVLVKKGIIAKVSRSVYYQLVDLLEVKKIKNTIYNGLYSGKEFFVLDKPMSRHKYLSLDYEFE